MLSDNTCAIIEEIQVEQLSKPETTYNFEVEDFHTYYVTDSKVLVHNKCAIDNPLDEAMEVYNEFDVDNAYVKPKHLSSTGGNGAKFIAGTKSEAEAVLKPAMKEGKIVKTAYNGITPLGNRSYKYIIDAGKIIGTKGQTQIQIVLAKGGGMLTAYPI